MAARDIIVIGASAGGIVAATKLLARLPADLPAALFLTVHIPSWTRSELPEVIRARSPLEVMHPKDQEQIRPGVVYCAPPDYHMLLEAGRVTLWKGPRENRHRPAINPLFRSAAVAYGPRVIGMILTGMLDDGAAGLWWVQHYGGITIVQDPSDAQFPEMPCSALEHVAADYILPVGEMPTVVKHLTTAAQDQVESSQEQLL